MGQTYTCAHCGGTFESDRSDADALMEFQEVFTEEQRSRDSEPPALVCDDCYNAMMAAMPPNEC